VLYTSVLPLFVKQVRMLKLQRR